MKLIYNRWVESGVKPGTPYTVFFNTRLWFFGRVPCLFLFTSLILFKMKNICI
ncbi:hypothetical protein HanIR_Chr10g0472971 [Helianthus annuus]|nr:hypothetical protein HanIR_Chr10g0472971 [Helianthus annuus]